MLETARDAPPIIDLAFGAIAAQVVYVTAELAIADRLADGPRTSAELAEAVGAHDPSLRRVLLAAAGVGIVAQVDRDRFALTDAGGALRADAPGSLRSLVRMLCGPEVWTSWSELAGAVRTGRKAWDRAHDLPVFDYYEQHPEAGAIFNAAMAEHTRDVAPAIVTAGDFGRFGTVLDVGGGDGTLLAEILRAHPAAQGVLFDAPAAVAQAGDILGAAGVADRCRIVTGDFFDTVPAGADAYVLKQILHDWDDEAAGAILRRCREAMPPEARILILERLLAEQVTPADRDTLFVDMLMLVITGGRERTRREFDTLLTAAGLTLRTVSEPLPLGYRLIDATAAR
jgi:hypothetical protein